MRKTPLILAGAIAFDLGVMVVSGHAAEPAKLPQPAPASKTAVDMFIKVGKAESASLNFSKFKTEYLKIDNVQTRQACKAGGGKVVKQNGAAACQTPADFDADGR